MVTINSGAPEPDDRFQDTPRDKWPTLLNAKKSFLSRRLNYDCRCLIQFCEEAELVYDELGFASAEEMIRDGYELEPSKVELAVAWLRANGTDKPVAFGDIVPLPTSDQTERPRNPNGRKGNQSVDNVNRLKGGNDTEYTLRRLARDAPELLEPIERGELSVNAAAIKAGIRKKKTPVEIGVGAFRKAENRLEFVRAIIQQLNNAELIVVRDWIEGGSD